MDKREIERGMKVRWTEAHDGWALDGRAVVKDADGRRAYFEGGTDGNSKEPHRGPAVLIFIHDDPRRDVWVPPDELMVDLEADKPYA
jgi:hypothetical protein